jgi:hypothetical protein
MEKKFISLELLIFLRNMGKFLLKLHYLFLKLFYRAKKKFEHFFKSITQGSGISCKPPGEYSQRFKDFVEEIFEGDQ